MHYLNEEICIISHVKHISANMSLWLLNKRVRPSGKVASVIKHIKYIRDIHELLKCIFF